VLGVNVKGVAEGSLEAVGARAHEKAQLAVDTRVPDQAQAATGCVSAPMRHGGLPAAVVTAGEASVAAGEASASAVAGEASGAAEKEGEASGAAEKAREASASVVLAGEAFAVAEQAGEPSAAAVLAAAVVRAMLE